MRSREMVVTAMPGASPADAATGGRSGGTGFFVRLDSELLDAHYFYGVTNKHVIENGASVARINLNDGSSVIADAIEPEWRVSETDDIAISHLYAPDMSALRSDSLPLVTFWMNRQP